MRSEHAGDNLQADAFVEDLLKVIDTSIESPAGKVVQLKRIFQKAGVLVPDTTKPGESVNTKLSADVRSPPHAPGTNWNRFQLFCACCDSLSQLKNAVTLACFLDACYSKSTAVCMLLLSFQHGYRFPVTSNNLGCPFSPWRQMVLHGRCMGYACLCQHLQNAPA